MRAICLRQPQGRGPLFVLVRRRCLAGFLACPIIACSSPAGSHSTGAWWSRWARGRAKPCWRPVLPISTPCQAAVCMSSRVGGAHPRRAQGPWLPAAAPALTGPMSAAAVNEYLAERDAHTMGKIFKFLGLTVGCVTESMTSAEKQEVYGRDVVYATGRSGSEPSVRQLAVPLPCVSRDRSVLPGRSARPCL